jgi:hypothetical protein
MKHHLVLGAAAALVTFGIGYLIFLSVMPTTILIGIDPAVVAARARVKMELILPAALALGAAVAALSWVFPAER